MSAVAHIPYWNTVLQEDYCHADGEPWPCLHTRQTAPPRCKCSHSKSTHTGGEDQCWSAVCGCRTYRPEADPPAIPARFDERYDPSPEPIDRKIR